MSANFIDRVPDYNIGDINLEGHRNKFFSNDLSLTKIQKKKRYKSILLSKFVQKKILLSKWNSNKS
jgi:hypothetical protein